MTTAATLQHTTDIFESLEPTDTEQAALALSEHCSEKPQSDSEVKEEIGDSYSLSDEQVSSLCSESEAIGFIDVEKIGSDGRLYFNGNLFRRGNAQKVHAVLSSMSSDDQRKINELDGMITKNACVTIENATAILGQAVFDKVCSIGIYDISVVSNNQEEVGYLTKASAFSKFSDPMVDDAFDLAKAFVSSLTYGMTRSQYARGQIRMVEVLLNTLIAGRPVGPVRAIENDYKILELKNVVRVYHGENKGRTGPLLQLLKKEVGILALEVIRKGDVSEQSLSILPSAAITQYKGPEVNRERKRRTQVQSNSNATNDMLLALRTGGAFK